MKKALLFIAGALILAACSSNGSSSTDDTLVFTDDYEQTVTVPAHPQRVVSASPAVTEILFSLGAQELLVGRTDYCNYPEAALKIETIGGISNINVEKIISLNPDLVISSSMVPRASVEQVNNMGVPFVCVIEKNNFDALYDNIARIGLLVGRGREADSLCQQLRSQVAELQTTDTAERPTIYYVIGYGKGGNFTAGGNTFIDDILTLAGTRNIAHEMQGWEYSLEALLSEDPDYILIRQEDSAAFCKAAPYSKLNAVKQKHVITLPAGMIDSQVPRNVEAIRLIHEKTHASEQKQ